MVNLYDEFKDDWQYIDEIEDAFLIALADDGQPDEAHPRACKVHRGNVSEQDHQFLGSALALRTDDLSFILFRETLPGGRDGGIRPDPGAMIVTDRSTRAERRYTILAQFAGVADTRWRCVCRQEQTIT